MVISASQRSRSNLVKWSISVVLEGRGTSDINQIAHAITKHFFNLYSSSNPDLCVVDLNILDLIILGKDNQTH